MASVYLLCSESIGRVASEDGVQSKRALHVPTEGHGEGDGRPRKAASGPHEGKMVQWNYKATLQKKFVSYPADDRNCGQSGGRKSLGFFFNFF